MCGCAAGRNTSPLLVLGGAPDLDTVSCCGLRQILEEELQKEAEREATLAKVGLPAPAPLGPASFAKHQAVWRRRRHSRPYVEWVNGCSNITVSDLTSVTPYTMCPTQSVYAVRQMWLSMLALGALHTLRTPPVLLCARMVKQKP
jgi:hypothetical protein